MLNVAFRSRPKCETSFPDGSPCDLEGIAKADPSSCPAYYQCVSGCVEHKVCPGGEVFSDMYMECEPRDMVSCGQRPCEEAANCEGDTNPTADPGDCTPEDQWIDCSQTGEHNMNVQPSDFDPPILINYKIIFVLIFHP